MREDVQPGLRVLADRKRFRIGTCVSAPLLQWDPQYANTVRREFNVITTENALKFAVVAPKRGQYNFSDADAIVDFAEANRMEVRGHVLVWHSQLPQWLANGALTRSGLVEILTTHIADVVGRYSGRIAAWDVVNEAVGSDGAFRESIWYKMIGKEYVDLAFRAARSADPTARLYYNDYGIEASDEHAEGIYELIRDLKQRDIPVDAVGLQMHVDMNESKRIERLPAAIGRLRTLGLEAAVTELDVRMNVQEHPTAEHLARQAAIYRQVLRFCLQTPRLEACVLWGFTDRHSWVPHFFPDQNHAAIFDENYCRKPAYDALAEELAGPSPSSG